MTIRREGSRALTSEQEQAYVMLCAGVDRLRDRDMVAVEVMHRQACAMDTHHDGVPVLVTAAYDLVETILRNEIVDAKGECACWFDAARRALEIRNPLSRAILVHSLLILARHPMVAPEIRQHIRRLFKGQAAEVAAMAVTRAVASTPSLVDACVVGSVMTAALLQDTLDAAAGVSPLSHR